MAETRISSYENEIEKGCIKMYVQTHIIGILLFLCDCLICRFNYARKANDEFSHRTPQVITFQIYKKQYNLINLILFMVQHGSPELRRNYIYPTQSTPVHAFQAPSYHSPKSFPLHQVLRYAIVCFAFLLNTSVYFRNSKVFRKAVQHLLNRQESSTTHRF